MKFASTILLLFSTQVYAQISVSSLNQKLHHALLFKDSLQPTGYVNPFIRVSDAGLMVFDTNGKMEIHIPKEYLEKARNLLNNTAGPHLYDLYRQMESGDWANIKLSQTSVTKKPESNNLPLSGQRIAIDPGHTSSDLETAKLEKKFLSIQDGDISHHLVEARLNLATALILRDTLIKLGAEVFLTRENHGNGNGLTFKQWYGNQMRSDIQNAVKDEDLSPTQAEYLINEATMRERFIFFNNLDLMNRSAAINRFAPDLVIIIHYNVDVDNEPWETLSDKNASMVFIPGAFGTGELKKKRDRAEIVRLLLTDHWEKSLRLAAFMESCFINSLKVPPGGSEISYLQDFSNPTSYPGVYCRNLSMTRLVHFPLVYGEPLYQDNHQEFQKLARTDGWISTVTWNDRLVEVAHCYLQGIMRYFEKKTN